MHKQHKFIETQKFAIINLSKGSSPQDKYMYHLKTTEK